MSKDPCEGRQMPCEATLDRMHDVVCRIGEPRPGENIKAGLARAAREIGLTFERAFSFRYRRARSVAAHEWLAAQCAEQRWVEQEMRRLDAQRALLAARQAAMRASYAQMATPFAAGAAQAGDQQIGVVAESGCLGRGADQAPVRVVSR
ncbi:hypothetical protein M0638_28320 [Roseomonas sp. NAR14]|uniref:Uncharacterized protein n=1 Tax=Roseomonas acroporae TaxID=2937791 RepID=A0A9X2BYC6_9PROT|nr:hypothetical protein [Roseomonas acroporae]MCK8788261.1 hypothetical protein [Roseomonas acroporae]